MGSNCRFTRIQYAGMLMKKNATRNEKLARMILIRITIAIAANDAGIHTIGRRIVELERVTGALKTF